MVLDNTKVISVIDRFLPSHNYSVGINNADNDSVNYTVVSGNEHFVLKYIKDDNGAAINSLLSNIHLANYLNSIDIASIKFLTDSSGDYFYKDDTGIYFIYEFEHGDYSHENLAPLHFYKIGEYLATIHRNTKSGEYIPQAKFKYKKFWEEIIHKIRINTFHNSELLNEIDVMRSFFDEIELYPLCSFVKLSNLGFNNDDEIVVRSMGQMKIGHTVDEIADFLMYGVYNNEDPTWLQQSCIDSFFDGYLNFSKLNKKEINLLNTYLNMHHYDQHVNFENHNESFRYHLNASKLKKLVGARLILV